MCWNTDFDILDKAIKQEGEKAKRLKSVESCFYNLFAIVKLNCRKVLLVFVSGYGVMIDGGYNDGTYYFKHEEDLLYTNISEVLHNEIYPEDTPTGWILIDEEVL